MAGKQVINQSKSLKLQKGSSDFLLWSELLEHPQSIQNGDTK